MLRAYHPLPSFPPVSLSGGCALHCQHCAGHYLRGMTRVRDAQELLRLSQRLEEAGGTGLLISGGCDREGRLLHLESMLDTLRRIKKRGHLIIALHPGLVDEILAAAVAEACHVAFADVIGDEDTVQQVIGAGSVDHYVSSIRCLLEAGVEVTPHLTVGLYYGQIRGEYRALSLLQGLPVDKVVINIVCPTPGTSFARVPVPPVAEVVKLIDHCHRQGWRPVLGCMRPRGRADVERAAIDARVEGIAVPSAPARAYAHKQGITIRTVPTCCGLPQRLLPTMEE